MALNNHIEVINDEPANDDNRAHIGRHAETQQSQERTWRTRWSHIRKLLTQSRNREPPSEGIYNESCECGEVNGRRGKRQSKNSRKGNETSRSYARPLSWMGFKDRFGMQRRRSNRPTSYISQESNIAKDFDVNREEDSLELARQSLCYHEPGSVENQENACDFLYLKTHSKYDESWIPSTIYKVINCSWYWGNIDCFEAAVALQTKADGYFLLRKSAQPDYLFTISFKRFNKTMHVRIEKGFGINDDMGRNMLPFFQIGEISPTYSKLLELIEHFGEHVEGNCSSLPLLLHPLHRTTPFSLKDLARAAVYKWCNYYSGAFYKIDSLHIPEELKLYLREFGYTQNVFDGID